jgi:hypothetical protein
MDATQSFTSHNYINLTAFRKTGQEVPTPVWFVEMDGKLYVFTGAQTGKAKRIRANGRARVAPSDGRGKPLGEFIPMRGRFVTDPEIIRRADELYKRKYGFQRTLIHWLNALRGRKDTPVLIELIPEST